MTTYTEYLDFLKMKGKPLSAINPGSEEIALNSADAIEAIGLLKNCNLPILGGDVLTIDSDKLVYVDQHWGEKYNYLNWYCEKMNSESTEEYSARSYEVAKKAISEVDKVAKNFGDKSLIVLVV